MIERTLVLIKPDGVFRSLVGEIIKRFEQRGLKIVAMKLVQVDKNFAKLHYTEDVAKRRGEKVRENLVNYITEGPVVAMILEGSSAIDNVRKITGPTESKSALPGTIRGDFSHMSFARADERNMPVKNLIHASANKEDAKSEIALWFKENEIISYKLSAEEHLW